MMYCENECYDHGYFFLGFNAL